MSVSVMQEHFDVTRMQEADPADRIVGILILVIVCSLPLGGSDGAIIYSVVLYFVLRRYVSKLQKKYGLLLKATNEIAGAI